MELIEQQELCRNAFIDVVSYFSTECPNMLTFYNLFKNQPDVHTTTIRINVQDDSFPILEYNPNWIEKCYRQDKKFQFIYAVYVEMLRFILHHTTSRGGGVNSACASSIVTNNKESRSVLNFMERSARENLIALLDTLPSRKWLEEKIAPTPLNNEDLIYEKIEAMLGNLIEEEEEEPVEQSTAPFSIGSGDVDEDEDEDEDEDKDEEVTEEVELSPEEKAEKHKADLKVHLDSKDCVTYIFVPEDTEPLQDYYSKSSQYECTAKWGENGVMDEMVTQTYESLPSSGWGTCMSDNTFSAIQLANRRKPNVKAILGMIRGQIFHQSVESTRMRPNRRRGMEIPGERHKTKGSVLIAIDTSGSMGVDEINMGLATVNPFLEGAEVDVAFWDTNCTDPVRRDGPIVIGEEIRDAVGGGGTLPESVGERLSQLNKHYDCVVIVTDCEWSWPKRNIPADTLLVVFSTTGKGGIQKLPGFVNFALDLRELCGM